jgi:hypothetical protein
LSDRQTHLLAHALVGKRGPEAPFDQAAFYREIEFHAHDMSSAMRLLGQPVAIFCMVTAI